MAKITFLECSKCGEKISAEKPATVCPKDAGVLYARYDLGAIKKSFTPQALIGRRADLWRYAEVLPDAQPVTLGEGFTAMLPSREYKNVYVKDEGLNPTGTFKARGLCLAVTMAKAYGIKKVAIPSAGNAASAMAAYAAAAGLEAHIFMPKDVPRANLVECQSYGAKVTLVDGLISDCARIVAQRTQSEGWFDVSTLKEPFRVEGKKTMGYEVAEQLGWKMPDAIIYPTGGGVGLIGMWKAFEEMETLGWIGVKRPKMIVAQSSGCAPIPKALDEGKNSAEAWPNAQTLAAGLRVPKPYGDYIILDIVRKSKGAAVAATDSEVLDAVRHWAQTEGIFAAPEGAAALVAYQKLRATGFLKESDITVIFNTGSGIKYVDVIADAHADASTAQKAAASQRAARHIGGIIGPY